MTSTITRRHFSVTYRVWYLPCHRVCGTSPAKSVVTAETLPATTSPPGFLEQQWPNTSLVPCPTCHVVKFHSIGSIGFTLGSLKNQIRRRLNGMAAMGPWQPSGWGSCGSARPTVGICVSGGKSGMAVLKTVANAKDLRSKGRSLAELGDFRSQCSSTARSCQGHFRAKATKQSLGIFSGWPLSSHVAKTLSFSQEETKPP